MKFKITLLFICTIFIFGCSDKKIKFEVPNLSTSNFSKSIDNGYVSSTKTKMSKINNNGLLNAKYYSDYAPLNYRYDLGYDFDVGDELYQIRHGDVSSPLLMLMMFQNTELSDVGYKLCLSSGRPEEQCFYSLGGVNLGYGLCMASPYLAKEDCKLAKGENNVGFGICMSSPYGNRDLCSKALHGNNLGFALCVASERTQNRYVDCLNALGGENTGYGFCLAAGRYESECRIALGKPNVGFGLCTAEMSNNPTDCAKAANTGENLGYGLCMASGHEQKEICEKALGNINLGYGICMTSTRSGNAGDCEQARNNPSIGFGICLASGRSEKECDNILGGDNIGSGICMAAYMPDGTRLDNDTCEKLNGADNTGAGLCMAAGRTPVYNYSDGTPNYNTNYKYGSECRNAKGSDHTGFGLCMLNNSNSYKDCNNLLGATNIGTGLCMLSDRGSKHDCYQALTSPSLGVGICMKADDHSENKCDQGLGGYNIGFGLCMTKHSNDTSSCEDLREQDLGNLKSDFLISINNGPTNSINKASVNSTTPIKIELALTPNYQYLGQRADVFVVASVTGSDKKTMFYQKNGSAFNPWEPSSGLSTLQPAYFDVELKGTMKNTIFDGTLANQKGVINLYHGYRLRTSSTNDLIYNNNYDITFEVK